MEVRYQIFEKHNLIIQKYSDEFSLEKYKAFISYIMESNKAIRIDKVLVDFRDMQRMEFDNNFFEDMDNITAIRRNIEEKQIRRKDILHVFWVDKPLPTVIAHLFISNFPDLNYKYCSTIDKVIRYLDLPKEFHDLKKIADNLEYVF